MSQAQTQQEWTLLDEKGATVINFTSFLDMDIRNTGEAVSYPVEEGSFANYNKVESPLDMRVTLATQGDERDFEYIITKLDEYKKKATLLSVITPAKVYENMTIESYSYERSQSSGARMLTAELELVEVRQVKTMVTTTVITKPKNPASSSLVDRGLVQTQNLKDMLTEGKEVVVKEFKSLFGLK